MKNLLLLLLCVPQTLFIYDANDFPNENLSFLNFCKDFVMIFNEKFKNLMLEMLYMTGLIVYVYGLDLITVFFCSLLLLFFINTSQFFQVGDGPWWSA